MDNSLKVVVIACSAIITCVVATIALFIYYTSSTMSDNTSYTISEMQESVGGKELSALVSNDTSGAYLISSMKKLNSEYMFKVTTKDRYNADVSKTYDVGSSLSDATNKSSTAWINPNATFMCTLIKDDASDELIGLEAKQTSDYAAVAAPIQNSPEFPGLEDLYKYTMALDTVRDDFNKYQRSTITFLSLKQDFEVVYSSYANTVATYYANVYNKGLDADQMNDYLLLRLLVRDGNYFKLSTIAKYTNLTLQPEGSYKLIPVGATPDTGYMCLADVDDSVIENFYGVTAGNQSTLSCTTSAWPLDVYDANLYSIVVFFSNNSEAGGAGGAGTTYLNIIDNLQSNLMSGLNLLNNLDKKNSRYSHNLDQALAYLDNAKLLVLSLNTKIQELNNYLVATKGAGGRIMPLPSVLADLIDTTTELYSDTFELGGTYYSQSRTIGASSLNTLYNGIKPFSDDYKDITTQLNDSNLGSYVASSLSLINKLIDVSAATGGASTDHDATDALDKVIQSVRDAR